MQITRRKSNIVLVGNVSIGGNLPIRVQSMTNTDTSDARTTAQQIIELANAGSEMVRITVNNDEAAKQVAKIVDIIKAANCNVPLIGDFHYNGHTLLTKYSDCASSLDKYRINPGNVGFGKKKDTQFQMMIETAIKYNKPVRIGVNWGSLDQELLAELMDKNSLKKRPESAEKVAQKAIILSALNSAKLAEKIGLAADKIIISCKVSEVQTLISVYKGLAGKCSYPLHLGLTEAGMGDKGIIASSCALAILLQEGIGDTIRISLTPAPGESRIKEVVAAQQILQSLGLRSFTPQVTACPGCGRTTSSFFQELAQKIQEYLKNRMAIWKEKYPGVEEMKVAVMGCIVNGPGESKNSDIGISLPGTGESPSAPVFVDGQKYVTLKGSKIAEEFQEIVENYVEKRFRKDDV